MQRTAALSVPRTDLILGVGLFAALLPLLGYAPYWFPHPPTDDGRLLADGYNNRIAYALLAAFLLTATAVFVLASARGWLAAPAQADAWSPVSPHPPIPQAPAGDYLLVAGVVALVNWPWFLAKQGPYVEDNYLLGFLFRLHCEQLPYRDFEYNYSPLSLYLPHSWMQAFGLSLLSFYILNAAIEVAKFTFLLAVLRRNFQSRTMQWGYFLLVAPLLINPLLGWNYNGIRQLLPAVIMALVAARPRDARRADVAAVLTAFLLAYSHDYGLFALTAVAAIFALLAWREQRGDDAWRGARFIALAVLGWFILAGLSMGSALPDYVSASLERTRAYDAGEWNLPFYWTVDALARFAMLLFACYLVGRGLARHRPDGLTAGDLLLWGAVVYTIAALKGGMHRPDIWHLAPPFFGLVFAFILPWPRAHFAFGDGARRFALALVALTTLTFLAGQAPIASFVARGWHGGWQAVMAEPSATPARAVQSRRRALETDRIPPRANVLALAEYLADGDRATRPVMFYHRAWPLDKMVGACSAIYPATGDLLSEAMGLDVARRLHANPTLLVVAERDAVEGLTGADGPSLPPISADYYRETPTKRILGWLSTVHFRSAENESVRAEARWARTVGVHLLATHRVAAEFGEWVVLQHAASAPTAPDDAAAERRPRPPGGR